MIGPQLLTRRLRQRLQLAAGAAEGHGDARVEHVAQLAEDDALLVTAQRRERHRGATRAHGGRLQRTTRVALRHGGDSALEQRTIKKAVHNCSEWSQPHHKPAARSA